MKRLSLVVLAALATALALPLGPAAATGGTTHFVDDDGKASKKGCDSKTPTHQTIQAGIAAAAAGDTVKVCPGTYPEVGQIVISRDLKLQGTGWHKPVVLATQDTGAVGDTRGWFLVQPGVRFDLSWLVLDGNGFRNYQGIRHHGFGSVVAVDFRDIQYDASGPFYAGTGLATLPDSGNVDVTLSSFREIGRVGVLYFGAGTDGAKYRWNLYRGKGPGNWLDYGVELGSGAKASIENSVITDNEGVAATDGSTSAGILVTTFFGSGTEAFIEDNFLTRNTTAIAHGFNATDTSVVEAQWNWISGNDFGYENTSATQTADAECNYWGAEDGPGGAGPGSGDPVSTMVDFDPWVEEPKDLRNRKCGPDEDHGHDDDDHGHHGHGGHRTARVSATRV